MHADSTQSPKAEVEVFLTHVHRPWWPAFQWARQSPLFVGILRRGFLVDGLLQHCEPPHAASSPPLLSVSVSALTRKLTGAWKRRRRCHILTDLSECPHERRSQPEVDALAGNLVLISKSLWEPSECLSRIDTRCCVSSVSFVKYCSPSLFCLSMYKTQALVFGWENLTRALRECLEALQIGEISVLVKCWL